MATAAEALRQFVIDPIVKRSPALFLLRALQLLHERSGGRSDAPLRRLAAILRPKVSLPGSARMDDRAVSEVVADLERRGWCILPWRLSAEDLMEIRAFAFSTEACADHPKVRIAIDEANPPNELGRYEWRVCDLVQVPAVQRLLSDSALYRVAQDYIGCRPVLTHLSLWIDVIHDRPFDAHVYHRDNDGPAFLKYFIYISDVDEDSGAHTFIEGSHRRRPAGFRSSERQDRDALLAEFGAEREIVFSAPAGTILAEDTSGFHRGMDPKTRPRLLMQVEFAAVDIPYGEEFILGRPRGALTNLAPGMRKIARKFVG
jgi:hypothetical protein